MVWAIKLLDWFWESVLLWYKESRLQMHKILAGMSTHVPHNRAREGKLARLQRLGKKAG